MGDSHLRSMIKAISWRVFGTFFTVIISFLFTHKVSLSIYIGLFEFLTKLVFFYIHERIWNKVSLGSSGHLQKNIEA